MRDRVEGRADALDEFDREEIVETERAYAEGAGQEEPAAAEGVPDYAAMSSDAEIHEALSDRVRALEGLQ